MESIFNGWERIAPYSSRPGYQHSSLGNKISICVSGEKTKYPQFKMNIGKSLINELGRRRFSLYKKGHVYALVPNNHGEFVKENKSTSHLKGMTKDMICDIAKELGVNPLDRPKFNAKVIGGAIVFPSDSFEHDTL